MNLWVDWVGMEGHSCDGGLEVACGGALHLGAVPLVPVRWTAGTVVAPHGVAPRLERATEELEDDSCCCCCSCSANVHRRVDGCSQPYEFHILRVCPPGEIGVHGFDGRTGAQQWEQVRTL